MHKTLVFGASLKSDRYSNLAVNRLRQHQVETVAFGLRQGEIAGVSVATDLKAFKNIHTVTLYISPSNQSQYYDAIVALKPSRVIFNPGTENPEFYAILRNHGITVEIACTLVLLATGQF